MSKVLIFLADGHEEIEALTVVDLLRRAGIDITMVSMNPDRNVTGSHNIRINADITLAEADFDSADMLVLPGGMPGTLNLEANELLMSKVEDFNNAGKYIAAICAAPTVFGHKGLLKGRKACCYPGMHDQLTGAEVSFDKVCADGNIITSRGLGTAIEFALMIISRLSGQAVADKIANSVVYESR